MTALLRLAAVLALPPLLLQWIRADALRHLHRNPYGAWLAFIQRVQGLTLVTLIATPLVAAPVLGPLAVAGSHRWGVPSMIVFVPGLLLPAAVFMAWSSLVVHEISVKVRAVETTRREAVQLALLRCGAFVVPWTFCLMTIGAMLQGQYVRAITFVVAGIVTAFAFGTALRRGAGVIPQAVTSGPLRERVFALAARANVRLQQLYIVPLGRMRLANAFALRGNQVILTDYLLEHLDCDEVDAVLAHEMAHLQLRHPAYLSVAALAMMAGTFAAFQLDGWIAGVAVIATGLLLQLGVSRRFEYVADRQAVKLGCDPRALVTGLVALNRLNHIPARWSGAREWWLTHPSTERRARALAKVAGVPAEGIEAWIESALEGTPPAGAPGDGPIDVATNPAAAPSRYTIPIGFAEPRLFSTMFKIAMRQRLGWTVIAITAIVPMAVVLFSHVRAFGHVPWPVSFTLAVLATVAAGVAFVNSSVLAPYRTLRRPIADRLIAAHHAPAGDATFVGLSLHESPRIYEGLPVWDLGFLSLEPGRLDYEGEDCRFSLLATEIIAMTIVPGVPGWFATPRVAVHWQRADGSSGTFCLLPVMAQRLTAVRRATAGLRAQLEAWRRRSGISGSHAATGTPPTAPVTNSTPRSALKPAGFAMALLAHAVVSIEVLAATRAPLDRLGAEWLLIVGAATLGYWILLLPILKWREPRQAAQARDQSEPRRRAA